MPKSARVVISNTTPIITLSILQRLDLLHQLYHAQRLGLTITGALGVLLRAKQQGYLNKIEPEIVRLRQAGIRLSTPLIERVLQLAGEK